MFLSATDIFAPGWGSGHWLGRLSEKWAVLLLLVYVFIVSLAILASIDVFFPDRTKKIWKQLLTLRENLGVWRWPIIGLVVIFPAWFVFYSPWGALFTGLFFRFLLFVLSLLLAAFLLTSQKDERVAWQQILLAGLIIGVLAVLAETFSLVTDYPFALHWSEGNRLWDYSVVFGRDRYDYSGREPIFAWIDPGRQFLWGLPYLIANVPIWVVRLWGAILVTVPYAVFGWVAFLRFKGGKGLWIIAGLWTLIFLNQGPVYTPLVLAAILVALARGKTVSPPLAKSKISPQVLLLAFLSVLMFLFDLVLVYFAGDYAGTSRFTWRFAPGIWAIMLTVGDAVLIQGELFWRDWLRAAALGLAGIWSKGLPIIAGILVGLLPYGDVRPEPPVTPVGGSVETLQGLQEGITHQPFLIERLFPNPVYFPGILIGVALATGPLILLIVYLVRKGFWKTIFAQGLVIILALGAFFVVGLIASAKVGGGADLHNMDMFLVALVLVASLAWKGGFIQKFVVLITKHIIVRWLLASMVIIPAFVPLISGKPLELPSPERTEFVLERIQNTVACSRQYGEVLFMDQRQLITFGQTGNLPLVVEYEKKYVMDQALAGNERYFETFRNDLASGRFSLIVSEREAILYKQPDIESIGDSLNEENNAWVTWVTTPLLQHYESVGDFKDAAIELFVPIGRTYDCP